MLKLRKTEQLRAGIYAICQRYITNQNSAASQKLQLAIQESEYTEEPEYPPIKDNSFKARKNEEKLTWHEQIKNAKTIEEKMIKINMPRYYGYKTVMLSDEKLPYNCLPATQHYTRTLMDSVSKTASTAQVEAYVSLAEQELQDALEYAYDYFKYVYYYFLLNNCVI